MSKRASKKQLDGIRNGNISFHENLSPEQKNEYCRKRKEGRAKISAEDEEENNRKRSIASKAMHDNMTSKEKKRLKKIWSEARKSFWTSKSEKEMAQIRQNMSQACKERTPVIKYDKVKVGRHIFSSISKAAQELELSYHQVYNRVMSESYPDYQILRSKR